MLGVVVYVCKFDYLGDKGGKIMFFRAAWTT